MQLQSKLSQVCNAFKKDVVQEKCGSGFLFRLFRLVYLCKFTHDMELVFEKPTKSEQKMASETVANFSSAISKGGLDSVRISIQESEEYFTMPKKALEFLSHILSIMAEGKAISLLPSESELTTQQAADILNISRPHIVKLLEQGIIPFKKVGAHRRILLEDLIKYANQQKETRKKNLKFLAKQAQELNLGYE